MNSYITYKETTSPNKSISGLLHTTAVEALSDKYMTARKTIDSGDNPPPELINRKLFTDETENKDRLRVGGGGGLQEQILNTGNLHGYCTIFNSNTFT
jgi:hypothetical protein